MARTRGLARREGQKAEARRMQQQVEREGGEEDSTICRWVCGSAAASPPPPRRQRRHRRSSDSGEGAPWGDMPENALYKVFETLRHDKDSIQAVSKAKETQGDRPGLPNLFDPRKKDGLGHKRPIRIGLRGLKLAYEAAFGNDAVGERACARSLRRRCGASALRRCGDGKPVVPRPAPPACFTFKPTPTHTLVSN